MNCPYKRGGRKDRFDCSQFYFRFRSLFISHDVYLLFFMAFMPRFYWYNFNQHPYILVLVDQKTDSLCLKEGLSDMELNECKVSTVRDKKKISREKS